MKIRKIEWKGHPVLGDLPLDFLDDELRAYDTIVFAGENGSGKTTILDALNDLKIERMKGISSIEYENGDSIIKYISHKEGDTISVRQVKVGHIIDGRIEYFPENHSEKVKDSQRLKYCISVYSKVQLYNDAKKIPSIKGNVTDKDPNISEVDSFTTTEGKQLLIDLFYQDAAEYESKSRKSPQGYIKWESFEKNTKIYRFSKAFDNFFDNALKYNDVRYEKGNYQVYFNKGDKDITIDNLSTGESQIVYRGTHLLRNVGTLEGSVIMIDEPEISMHPKWQQRILKYYRDIFVDGEDQHQKAQLFFATHSEYVVSSALGMDNGKALVIVLKAKDGKIEAEKITKPKYLEKITSAEVNYIAFGIPSVEFHQLLYGAIQSIVSNMNNGGYSVSKCDEFINSYIDSTFPADKEENSKYKWPDRAARDRFGYNTLCTFVRNRIDHPIEKKDSYNPIELATSIELMVMIMKEEKEKSNELMQSVASK